MTRPWLIGESNPYREAEEFALYPAPKNCSGWRLCHLVLGLDPSEYLERFERRNLLRDGKWSAKRARESAERLLTEASGATLVLLGAKVTEAFGIKWAPFGVTDTPRGAIALLPHPSGRSRAWNDPESFERARDALRQVGAL